MPIAFPHAEVVIGAATLTPRGNVIHDRFGDEPGTGMSLAALHRDGRFRERFGQGGIIHPGGDDAPGASDGVLIDGGLVVVGAAQRDMWAARYLLGAR